MSTRLHAQLEAIAKSAIVMRYHTEHTVHKQSVGEHTYGVLWLIYLLTDGKCSAELLLAALAHDTPECSTGDVPAPTKRANAYIRDALVSMETAFMEDLGFKLAPLTKEEEEILKIADVLEGCMYCANEAERGNRLIKVPFRNFLAYAESLRLNQMGQRILLITKGVYDGIFR